MVPMNTRSFWGIHSYQNSYPISSHRHWLGFDWAWNDGKKTCRVHALDINKGLKHLKHRMTFFVIKTKIWSCQVNKLSFTSCTKQNTIPNQLATCNFGWTHYRFRRSTTINLTQPWLATMQFCGQALFENMIISPKSNGLSCFILYTCHLARHTHTSILPTTASGPLKHKSPWSQ